MSKAEEILFKIDKANKMTFDCINNCYTYEDCDGNRITITKEEQRIIDDYISPVKHIDYQKVKELRLDRRRR